MSSSEPNPLIKQLAKKWQENTITEEEKHLFNLWYDSFDDDSLENVTSEEREQLAARLYQGILEKENIRVSGSTIYRWRPLYAVAALLLVFLAFGGYFLLQYNTTSNPEFTAKKKVIDVSPGQNKAVLTLADGTKIKLTGSNTGILASEGNVSISKNKEGQIVYETLANDKSNTNAIAYNTLSTPRGGQYQVNLPDGTKVWLNATTTLKFPVVFNKNERRVELNGEAYFEVNPISSSKGSAKKIPFLVISHGQKIEVLGTHFNVNAYADEPNIKTTLLEGSVKVINSNAQQSAVLKPGQQSVVDNEITVTDVDATQAIDWQQGYFTFDNESVESIMRKISRWYNVSVTYQGNIRHRKFGGRISKFENVSQILQIMEKTKVIHFKIEERRIIVMP